MFRWVIVWALMAMIAINAHQGNLMGAGIPFVTLLVLLFKRQYSRQDAYCFVALMLISVVIAVASTSL